MAELFSIGNKFAAFDGESSGSLSNLRIRITNGFASTLTAELFNVLQSVVYLGSTTALSGGIPTPFRPFTAQTVNGFPPSFNNLVYFNFRIYL
jgi:hypothetical protein